MYRREQKLFLAQIISSESPNHSTENRQYLTKDYCERENCTFN